MNILIVSCVFAPEPVVSSKSSYSLAIYLTNKKNKVKVLAPYPSRPNKNNYPPKKMKLYHTDKVFRDFDVVRCFSIFSEKSTLLSRFIENISFGITSSFYLLFSKKYDVIYSNTWPIFASFLITITAKVKGIPIVTSVQDLYPETLVNQGRISSNNSFFNFFLSKIDKYILVSSYKCIAISDGFKTAIINKGIKKDMIEVVYNWNTSEDYLTNEKIQINFRDSFNIQENDFLIIFAGNISSSAGVAEIIKLFSKVESSKKNAYLCIAGEGSQHESCIKLAQKLRTNNVIFHYPWKKNETESLLKSANLLILPTLEDQALFSVPSKLISYMHAKRPILTIANKDSDLSKIISKSNSGWSVEISNAEEVLYEAIDTSSETLTEYGNNAFNYGNRYFNANLNLAKIDNILTNAKKNI